MAEVETGEGGGARAGAAVVLVLDVDGVLAADPGAVAGGEATVRARGYTAHRFDGPGPDGVAIEGVVWLNPDHGGWLRELGLRGFQLVWASSWGVRARDWIAPRLGLPADLPVIEVPRYGPRFGWSAKFPAITRWVGERPFAWIDDRFGGKESGWAEQREQAGIPTLILPTDPGHGLRREHVQRLLEWIDNPPAVVGDVVHRSEHDDAAVEPGDCPDGDIAHRLDSDPDGYGCGEWGEAAWIEREAERLHTQEWAPDDEPWGSLGDTVREQWRREAQQLVRGGRDGRGQ